MSQPSITSSRPYLIRAIHEWLSDNGLTPQLIVNAAYPGVRVPQEHVSDGLIVLNVSMSAVGALHMGNDVIEFAARFSGRSRDIHIPVEAVLGLHARENSIGMSFPREEGGAEAADEKGENDGGGDEPTPSPGGGGSASRPALRVVK